MEHSAAGTLPQSAFHGHTVDYEVETDTGTLNVTVPGPDPAGILGPGTQVSVTLDPRRAYLLTAD